MIWVFHNDIIDYVFMQYPFYDFIASHIEAIAYLAFWLSVIPLVLYLSLTLFKKIKYLTIINVHSKMFIKE